MEIVPPVPKPRLEHRTGAESGDRVLKRPVPLPRNKLAKHENVSENANSAGQSMVSETQQCSETENIYENSEEMESVKKTSAKGDSKVDLESIQEKAKAVIRSTWTASTKRSFRNIIPKRLTAQPSPPKEETDSSNKVARSQSLPTSDIFQSISFPSPLIRDQFADQPLVDCDDCDSDDSPPGPPPPVYPPPPLPDESVYDEVQSVASTNSSSPYPYFSERVYEDIALIRDSSHSKSSSSLEKCLLKDPKFHLASPVITSRKNASRADSWSFYDSTPSEDIYQNVASVEMSDFDDIDSLMVDARTVSDNSSISPSLQELEALACGSSDETSDDFHSSSSSRCEMPQSQSVINEAYENWGKTSNSPVPIIPPRLEEKKRQAISRSVIIEFDPFYPSVKSPNSATKKDSSELLLLTGGAAAEDRNPLYGKIKRINKVETTAEEMQCPPVPPRRYDSLASIPKSPSPSEIPSTESNSNEASARSSPTRLTDDEVSLQEKTESASLMSEKSRKLPLRLASIKKKLMRDSSALKRSSTVESKTYPSSTFYETKTDEPKAVERPVVLVNKALKHIGELYRSSSGNEKVKDFVQRRCVITEGKLTCFLDKSGMNIVDIVPLDKVISIQLLLEPKTGSDAEVLYFFELNLLCKVHTYTLGATGLTERRIWMQKILESVACEFPLRVSTEYTRAGWCFLKEGISGIWNPAWLLIQNRTLFYYMQSGTLQEADLRKARCIALQDSSKELSNLCVSEKGKLILVDFPGQALYLQMDSVRETEAWQNVIRTAALNNGFHLAQQQLTREEIPTIVDKCINFVYAHGSMSEGIYRRSGANSSVTRLLTQFREDAWAVQLTRQEYTEYDVSSVLKRFFRELPEPLLTTELHSQLCEIAAGKMGSDRLTHFRHVLEQLPPINYLTTRKLIGHLHFIHLQQEKNLMPVENLAAIWGPTLMHVEGGENTGWSKAESSVISDLILMYPQLFGVDANELSKEKKMLEVLERYHAGISNVPQSKPSGDLKVWIHLENKDSGNCVNVTIGPQKTAGEVCTELASKMMLPAHELCLEEVVLTGGTLTRPLHYTERVLDTVLRWGYWDDADRKDNYLVLCKNELFKEAATHTKRPLTLCGDLRFADQKNKSFKSYLFEFSQAKLCYYKDKKGSVKLGEWKIEDIVWYVGHERKRNPQMRSKEHPYFGYTIAGTSKEEQMRWIATMLIGEYPQGLLPSPLLLE